MKDDSNKQEQGTHDLGRWRIPESEVRVVVAKWIYREELKEQYIEHPRSIWLVWNYVLRFGILAVINKIRSRLAERIRNDRIVGLGVGYVVEAPDGVTVSARQPVVFFAPNHNGAANTVVVDVAFVVAIPESRSELADAATPVVNALPDALMPYRAWSPHSGVQPDRQALQSTLGEIALQSSYHQPLQFVDIENNVDHVEVSFPKDSKPTAVLFGLGNYAKTVILPNINKHIDLRRIHEIDPEQLRYLGNRVAISCDSSPFPRDDQRFDAWFIAGYHHMHSDLACKAVEQGAAAVIEKPLATTRQQYEEFLSVLNRYPEHRFYLCFHKRYSELNEYLRKDIAVVRGEPIDMHSIVYEIPLPQHHWYNWPSSGSRLISNGCHWLDYFMWVNDYSAVVDYRKWLPRGKDVVVQVKLENGAYFSMVLTDTGSQRLGVREHVELRNGAVTVTIGDASCYSAEDRRRVFRKARVNPLNAYARMYETISSEIVTGGKGDDIRSLRSSELTLLLEEL